MNKTWNLRDDPANYDDEGNYDGGVAAEDKVTKARDFYHLRCVELTEQREELLAACKRLLAYSQGLKRDGLPTHPHRDAKNAIAKAEGRAQ